MRNPRKLSRSKYCHCPGPHEGDELPAWIVLSCGCCRAIRCTRCGMILMEAGLVFCKRKNQWYRNLIYPDMDVKPPVPRGKLHRDSRPRKIRRPGS